MNVTRPVGTEREPQTVGRNTKWTPQRWEMILSALRVGNTRRTAARYGRIAESTFYKWIAESDELLGDVEEAEAQAEVGCVTRLRQLVNRGNASAIQFFLTHKPGTEWRKTEHIEMEVTDDGVVDDLLEKFRAALAATGQQTDGTDDPTSI